METATRKGCMGLWSMKERVALLNGQMKIKSENGVGTHIFIEIPYDE
jgi:signal transduction histidine kinase